MSWFSKIFSQSARKNYFPPKPAEQPPQPEGYWSIIVDENGDRVTSRPPAATDFLARPPVDYVDGGTEPAFQKDPRRSEADNVQEMIAHEIRRQKNKEHLSKAVFLLSQTDDGIRLLQKAKDMKFALVFDDAACSEANAVGLCDYANKKIPLAEGRSAAEVALTLKHELQHMEDISKGMAYDLTDTPRNAILVNRALEGNARVSEAVLAAEAMIGSPHGPARQFRTAAMFNMMWQKNPEIAREADSALEDAGAGKWTKFAAKVLPAYFRETGTLAYYDDKYFQYIDKYVPDVSASIKAAKEGDYQHRGAHQRRVDQARANAQTLFTKDRWTADKISGLLTIRGLPYMQGIAQKGFSFAGDAVVALTAKAPTLFEKLKQNIKTVLPESDKGALLDLPLATEKKKLPPPQNPYAQHASKLEGEAFAPIRLPHHMDGSKLTDGTRSHESTTKLFNDMFNDMKSGKTDTDRIHYSISQYLHHNRGIANVRGLVGNLLEAGLRAPIGAFPEEYVFDLYGRATLSMRGDNPGKNPSLDPAEIQLFEHWQQMKNSGMDPVWMNPDNKKASWVSNDGGTDVYIKYVERMLKDPPATSSKTTPTAKPQAS